MKISIILRALLTIALLAGIYSETGIFTTISIGLLFLSVEIAGFALQRKNKKG